MEACSLALDPATMCCHFSQHRSVRRIIGSAPALAYGGHSSSRAVFVLNFLLSESATCSIKPTTIQRRSRSRLLATHVFFLCRPCPSPLPAAQVWSLVEAKPKGKKKKNRRGPISRPDLMSGFVFRF